MKKTTWLINIALALSLLLSYWAPAIDPQKFSYLSFFGLTYPILLVSNVLFVIGWLFFDYKRSILSIMVILVGFSYISGFYKLSPQDTSTLSPSISVITYNFNNASRANDRNKDIKEKKQQAMGEFLKRFKDEDIICFQEANAYALEIIKTNFGDHHMHRVGKHTIILSRFPIVDKGLIDFGTVTNSCVWADVQLQDTVVRIYNLHLQSNRISATADKLAKEGQIDQEDTWKKVGSIFDKYRQTHIRRSKQAQQVKNHIDASPHPVLVCGDFNDPPMTYTYRHLSKGLKDTYLQQGEGLGTTFAGSIPLQRIDYILVDSLFTPMSHKIITEPYSDHYPVASLLNLSKL